MSSRSDEGLSFRADAIVFYKRARGLKTIYVQLLAKNVLTVNDNFVGPAEISVKWCVAGLVHDGRADFLHLSQVKGEMSDGKNRRYHEFDFLRGRLLDYHHAKVARGASRAYTKMIVCHQLSRFKRWE